MWQKTGGTLIPPITVSQSNSPTPAPTQLPNHYKWDQNQSSHFRKKDINFSQTSICAQAEFLPLCYPQLQAAGRLWRSLPIRPHDQATHLWMRWLFSKCKTVDHGWLPPFFPTKPSGRWVHCISSIQCWYIWFPSRTDQTLNNIEQADCEAKTLAMKSFHSQLIS